MGAGAGDIDLLRLLDHPVGVEGFDQEEVLAVVQKLPGHGPVLQAEAHHPDGGGIARFHRVAEEAAAHQVPHLDVLQVQDLLDGFVDGEAEVRAFREEIPVAFHVPGEGHGDVAVLQALDHAVHADLAAGGLRLVVLATCQPQGSGQDQGQKKGESASFHGRFLLSSIEGLW